MSPGVVLGGTGAVGAQRSTPPLPRPSSWMPSSPAPATGSPTRRGPVVRLPVPMAGLREGLLPGAEVPTDPRRFSDWLTEA